MSTYNATVNSKQTHSLTVTFQQQKMVRNKQHKGMSIYLFKTLIKCVPYTRACKTTQISPFQMCVFCYQNTVNVPDKTGNAA